MQLQLFRDLSDTERINLQGYKKPLKVQLLKWVGNKQRFAQEIISYFPQNYGTYFEPFLGSGGVLANLAPENAIASDIYKPLIVIFRTLKNDPEELKKWYQARWHLMMGGDKAEMYEKIKASYNKSPNAPDLLFISRSCYAGIIRFRKDDGYISTPVGPHNPISPKAFNNRVDLWHQRVQGTEFLNIDYKEAIRLAKEGDLIYCDPPYSHSQAILYGAQTFDLEELFDSIAKAKFRGVRVALSIDGTKKSGDRICNLPVPKGLFAREIYVNVGKSMLKRLQMNGKSLEGEVVRDRLLLTY